MTRNDRPARMALNHLETALSEIGMALGVVMAAQILTERQVDNLVKAVECISKVTYKLSSMESKGEGQRS